MVFSDSSHIIDLVRPSLYASDCLILLLGARANRMRAISESSHLRLSIVKLTLDSVCHAFETHFGV